MFQAKKNYSALGVVYKGSNALIKSLYLPLLAKVAGNTGLKILALAHTSMEGFSNSPAPGTLSYRLNNPGNIGTSTGPGHPAVYGSFPTMLIGVQKQINHFSRIFLGQHRSYPLKGQTSLSTYIYKYAPPEDGNNTEGYIDWVIKNFKNNNIAVSRTTTLNQIAAIV